MVQVMPSRSEINLFTDAFVVPVSIISAASAIKTQYKARINLGPLVGDQSWTRRGPEEDPPQTGCLALSLRLEIVPISPAAAVVEAGADSVTECPAGERGSAGSGNT